MTRDFKADLQWSEGLSGANDNADFYRCYWPDLIQVVTVRSGANDFQRRGVDKIVLLANGKQVTVDEKWRQTDYGDFLCEEWSVCRGPNAVNKPGWTLDLHKQCDYLAWLVVPTGRGCLLPFELLRATCIARIEAWKKLPRATGVRYPKDSPNGAYVTRNIAVPWSLLWQDMRRVAGSGRLDVEPTSGQLPLVAVRP